MKDSRKKLPGQFKLGDSAYYRGEDGKRHLVEITTIPAGHLLVIVKGKSADDCEQILMTVPADNLYPLE